MKVIYCTNLDQQVGVGDSKNRHEEQVKEQQEELDVWMHFGTGYDSIELSGIKIFKCNRISLYLNKLRHYLTF